MDIIIITIAILATVGLVYQLVKRIKNGKVELEPNYFYPVLTPNLRSQILNVSGLGYDVAILEEINDSFERLKGLAPYYQTNYKDLMYLQLHLDNGKTLDDFGVGVDEYNELIDRVDDFFMDKLAFGIEPKGGKRYYLPDSLENKLIGWH